MLDDLDIPEFLRAEVSARAELTPEQQSALKARLATVRKPSRRPKKHRYDLPREMTPECWAMLRAIEKARAEKQAARLAALKEMRKR